MNLQDIRVGTWLLSTNDGKMKKVSEQTISSAVNGVNNNTVMPIVLKEQMLMKMVPMVPSPSEKTIFDFKGNSPWVIRLIKVNDYWAVHLYYGKIDVEFYPHLRDIEYVHELQGILWVILGMEITSEP